MTGLPLFDLAPLSHSNDPDTSRAAADMMARTGSRRRQAESVLAKLRERDGATSAELAHWMYGDWREWLRPARRLSELERNGYVKKGDARICLKKGSRCVTWWIV